MKILVSGLINIETTLKIKEFPINYYPIDYPFFGIQSQVAGVAYNLAKSFQTLGDEVELVSYVGNDDEGKRILNRLKEDQIDNKYIMQELKETPASIILYDVNGKRQIYCDLKDIQDRKMTYPRMDDQIEACDMIIACNSNFNRLLIKRAKELHKTIATDVHVLSDIEDDYNREFMQYADILFFSDELLPCSPSSFIDMLKGKYSCKIYVVGMGAKGAMLYDSIEDKKYFQEAVKLGPVVNTVGAGDALFSSFLHYYGKGFSPIESLKRAQIFAAIKIGYNGASIGFCNEAELEKVYNSGEAGVIC